MQPISFASKYQPKTIAAFAGLDRPKALFQALAAAPYSAWLLVGPSGTGKTTMAMAFAAQVEGELHHIPSRKCDLATVEEVVRRCWYTPMLGRYHVIVCDEADRMSLPAQHAFLSKLDATAMPPDTIFIFTANSTKLLEDRFQSRCRVIAFATDRDAAAKLLGRIWRKETKAKAPDFSAILSSNGLNIRAALMDLETEMIAPMSAEERASNLVAKAEVVQIDQHQKRREAALKAWVTIRAKKGAA